MAEGATRMEGCISRGAYGRRNGQTGIPHTAPRPRPYCLQPTARDAFRQLPDDGGDNDADTQRQVLQRMGGDSQPARPAQVVAQRVAHDDQKYDGTAIPLRGDILRQLREVPECVIF